MVNLVVLKFCLTKVALGEAPKPENLFTIHSRDLIGKTEGKNYANKPTSGK